MKRATLRLAGPALAAALMLGVAAGPARAYFTASDYANGGLTIKQPDTTITEDVVDNEKSVTIVNNEESVPVWVRVRVFGADELDPQISGNNWTDEGNGWWTYDNYLNPGESTADPLNIKFEWVFTKDDVREDGTYITNTSTSDQGGEEGGNSNVVINMADGTNYNIVVVYEAQPVKFAEDGITALPAEWK